MKIYFAGSIRAGRGDTPWYARCVESLGKYGEVLTEHVGDGSLSQLGEDRKKGDLGYIHSRDMAWLKASDVIVAEVSQPSLGVGYEIASAIFLRKPILCLYRKQPGKRLSGMIEGNPDLTVYEFETEDEALSAIDAFFSITVIA